MSGRDMAGSCVLIGTFGTVETKGKFTTTIVAVLLLTTAIFLE